MIQFKKSFDELLKVREEYYLSVNDEGKKLVQFGEDTVEDEKTLLDALEILDIFEKAIRKTNPNLTETQLVEKLYSCETRYLYNLLEAGIAGTIRDKTSYDEHMLRAYKNFAGDSYTGPIMEEFLEHEHFIELIVGFIEDTKLRELAEAHANLLAVDEDKLYQRYVEKEGHVQTRKLK